MNTKEGGSKSMQEVRVVRTPGIPLGTSISAWFDISKTSPGHEEYRRVLAEVDQAERNAVESAGTVIIRGKSKYCRVLRLRPTSY